MWEVTKVPDEIEEKVIEIVAEQMGVDKSEITRETSFVNDLNAAIAEMNRLGFEQLGPIGGGAGGVGSIAIVFFYDPDGIKVELWGPISQPNPDSAC